MTRKWHAPLSEGSWNPEQSPEVWSFFRWVYRLLKAAKVKPKNTPSWELRWPPSDLLPLQAGKVRELQLYEVKVALGELQCCLRAEGQLCLQDGAAAWPCYTWLHLEPRMLTCAGMCACPACWCSCGCIGATSITWPVRTQPGLFSGA